MKLVTKVIKLGIFASLTLLFSLVNQDAKAQATGVEMEIYFVHNGVNSGLPAGYITYRCYVTFTNPEDVMGSVYAVPGGAGSPPFSVTTDCDFYQNPNAGLLAQDNNPAFWPIFPDMEWDSWLTIGKENSFTPGANTTALSIPAGAFAPFEAGNSFTITDGIFFIPNNNEINTIAGADLRVLVGQFTTCGEVCVDFNIGSFGMGIPGNLFELEDESAEACISSPCAPGLFEIETVSSSDVSCFGADDGTFVAQTLITGQGLPPILWDLIEESDLVIPFIDNNADGNFSGLPPGNYFVVAEDNNGCLDSTEVVVILEPEELILDAEILQEILCAGDDNGEIGVTITGGTEPYALEVNGLVLGTVPASIVDLECGIYTITVTDDHGCTATQIIEIDCPDPILANLVTEQVTCFEACDASIGAGISGGTGDLSVTVTGPNGFLEDFAGNPVNFLLPDLCAGDYLVSTMDENSCVLEETITITEPDELVVTEEHFDASCFGICDGVINLTIVGGTLPYNSDFGGADPSALCAGIYEVEVCDGNNCCVQLTIEIEQPTELIVETTVVDVVCPEELTGSITVDASGSLPDYSYEITGPLNVGPQSTNVFANLPGGDYELTVTDQGACFVIQNLTVETPDPFVIDVAQTDINCFEVCDGTLIGIISGGTGDLNLTVSGPDGFNQVLVGNPLNINLTELCAGEYIFDVVDQNDCAIQDSFILTQPEEFIVTEEHTNVSCFNLCDGTITLDISGGVEPYSSDFAGFDPNALCAGNYVVTVCDDNNCCVELNIEITQPDELIATIQFLDVICPGDDNGEITVTAIGGVPDYTYDLTGPVNQGPQTESIFQNLPGGVYTLTITDDTNCSLEEEVSIFAPQALNLVLDATDITCNGFNDGIIEVTPSGGTGEFTFTANDVDGGPIFSSLSPDDYLIVGTDENGCTVEETATIIEADLLVVELTFLQEVGCGGDCDGVAEVEVSGGVPTYTIVWNQDPLQANDELCAGENLVEVTDANSCVTPLSVQVDEPDPLQIIINENPVTCTGMTDGSAAVAVSGGTGEVTLDLGELSPEDLLQLPEGEYIVTAVDITGCSVQDTINIIAAIVTDLEIEVFTSPVSCWNEGDGTATAAITGGFEPITIQWDDELEQTGPIAIGLAEGLYTVTITDVIGCTIDSVALIEPSIGCFFIANVLTPNGDGSNDNWLIGGLEYFPDSKVQVYNRWGQLLFESSGYTTPWNGTYGGQLLPIADYYYVIEYDNDKEPLTGTVTVKY